MMIIEPIEKYEASGERTETLPGEEWDDWNSWGTWTSESCWKLNANQYIPCRGQCMVFRPPHSAAQDCRGNYGKATTWIQSHRDPRQCPINKIICLSIKKTFRCRKSWCNTCQSFQTSFLIHQCKLSFRSLLKLALEFCIGDKEL